MNDNLMECDVIKSTVTDKERLSQLYVVYLH
uniref:Uncharacterized protein n=1 Tax=Lepeophtheirus salmonis TaxID=72036 RepID=A0A0K2V7U9_LEPSM